METVRTLIKRRVLRRLIWVYTVFQCPFYGTPGLNGLRNDHISFIRSMSQCTLFYYHCLVFKMSFYLFIYLFIYFLRLVCIHCSFHQKKRKTNKYPENAFEPEREKTFPLICAPNEHVHPTNMCAQRTCAPYEHSNQNAHPRSRVRGLFLCMKKFVLSAIHTVHWRFWSDCANSPADLIYRLSHTSEDTFLRTLWLYFNSVRKAFSTRSHVRPAKTQTSRFDWHTCVRNCRKCCSPIHISS